MPKRGEQEAAAPSPAANLTIKLRPVGELSIGVPHDAAPHLLRVVTLGITMGGPGWTLWAGTVAHVPVWLTVVLAFVQTCGGVIVLIDPRRIARRFDRHTAPEVCKHDALRMQMSSGSSDEPPEGR